MQYAKVELSRAFVHKQGRYWRAWRANKTYSIAFLTWREAIDYALRNS